MLEIIKTKYDYQLYANGKIIEGAEIFVSTNEGFKKYLYEDDNNLRFLIRINNSGRNALLSKISLKDFPKLARLELMDWKVNDVFVWDVEYESENEFNKNSFIRYRIIPNLSDWKYEFSFIEYKTEFLKTLRDQRLLGWSYYVTDDLEYEYSEINCDTQHIPSSKPIKSELNLYETNLLKLHEEIIQKLKANYEKAKFSEKPYDVFISHAYEDKEDFVRPLAEALKKAGFRVWYDEFELRIGDKLRRSIDKGLVTSRFGIVVFSPNFFQKNWTQYELDGLVQREMAGEKTILPLWHRVSKDEVMKYSPSLTDTIALNTAMFTIDELVKKISEVLK